MLKIAWNSLYCHPLPSGHRFPMEKYNLLPEQLLHEGTIRSDNLFEPIPLFEEQILLTHDLTYWNKLKTLTLTRQEERRSGFPLSELIVKREITINGGTLQAADYALQYGIAMNVAGGTHHAYTNRAEGFCFLNDMAIAANCLLQAHKVKQVLIIDLDVHQGNGTAEIFQHDPRVFTFSMHGAKNYPMHKETSDHDIALPDGTDDKRYLKQLENALAQLVDQLEPDFIFYQSGVDVLATDKLGRLALSREGCRQRDAMVLKAAKRHEIPLVACMGGGYSEDIRDIIEAHANTYRLAQEIYF